MSDHQHVLLEVLSRSGQLLQQTSTSFTSKISIKPQLLKLLRLLLLPFKLVVSCSIPGARGGLPGNLRIPRSLVILLDGDLFSSLLLTPCLDTICFRVDSKLAPKWDPNMSITRPFWGTLWAPMALARAEYTIFISKLLPNLPKMVPKGP